MTVGDLRKSISIILDDTVKAEVLLDIDDTPFHRRTYIRNHFSSMEGCIWLMKQACLKAKSPSGKHRLSIAEYMLLAELNYEIKDNGDVKVQSKTLKLSDNLKFTIRSVNRILGINLNLEVGTKKWHDFQAAVKVRNRITHPKNLEDTTITDEEIEICKRASGWFVQLVHDFFMALVDKATNHNPKRKSDDEVNL